MLMRLTQAILLNTQCVQIVIEAQLNPVKSSMWLNVQLRHFGFLAPIWSFFILTHALSVKNINMYRPTTVLTGCPYHWIEMKHLQVGDY